MLPIKTILYPTDFSDNAAPALEMAGALARDYGAKLVILHVVRPPTPIAANGFTFPVPPNDLSLLRGQLRRVKPAGVAVEIDHVLIEGDEAMGILQQAVDSRADLIVMGTHGRGGLGRLLMGSVAERVLRSAPCPVVTVKRPLPNTPPGESAPAREATAGAASA